MRFTNNIRLTILVILSGLLLSVTPVFAQEGEGEGETTTVSDDAVNEVAEDLFCPVCESTPLDVCATKACADWRELIRTKLAEGQTEEEIFDYFARQYGDGVLADPPRRGFNLVLWTFPIVAVLLGGFLFMRFMQNLRAEADDAEVSVATPAGPAQVQKPKGSFDDYINQVEAELNE